jgi:hypothetical protein
LTNPGEIFPRILISASSKDDGSSYGPEAIGEPKRPKNRLIIITLNLLPKSFFQ